MEPATMSTMSALTGTVIGGVTTFASSWLTRATQFRAEGLVEQKEKRDELYGRFLDEAMRLTLLASDAGPDEFVAIRSMHMRILLLGSDEVVTLGERVIAGLENGAKSLPSDAGKTVSARAQISDFAQAALVHGPDTATTSTVFWLCISCDERRPAWRRASSG